MLRCKKGSKEFKEAQEWENGSKHKRADRTDSLEHTQKTLEKQIK